MRSLSQPVRLLKASLRSRDHTSCKPRPRRSSHYEDFLGWGFELEKLATARKPRSTRFPREVSGASACEKYTAACRPLAHAAWFNSSPFTVGTEHLCQGTSKTGLSVFLWLPRCSAALSKNGAVFSASDE